MLVRLTIENYVLIERLDIEFPDGLIIITGETGAGKSILLGALSLLMGKKADVSVLKDKSRNCVIEAEFKTDEPGRICRAAGDSDFCDSGKVILRRVIAPSGRSRSFLNDEPVNAKTLSDISVLLVDIHAQHQHLLLADNDFHRNLLDLYSGISGKAAEYGCLYRDYKALSAELEKARMRAEAFEREADYKKFQLSRLEGAGLKEGEMEELQQEHNVLAHAEEISSGLGHIMENLNPQGMSLSQCLKNAYSAASKLGSFNERYVSLSERIESCKIELQDIESEVSSDIDGIEVSPQRLAYVEERISDLQSLMRKFSAGSISDLVAIRDRIAKELSDASDFESAIAGIEKKMSSCESMLESKARELYEERKKHASSLSSELTGIIRSLEMPYASLEYDIKPSGSFDRHGSDTVDVFFSANGANNKEPLAMVASGGEMSRIALAVKSLMSEYSDMPTMIFDEIDTGVSGRAADKMGQLIGRLGKNMQVFAITHLPQIASKGHAHYLVYKTYSEDGTAESNIKRLSGQERVREIARMLSGSEVTKAAMENAAELLDEK